MMNNVDRIITQRSTPDFVGRIPRHMVNIRVNEFAPRDSNSWPAQTYTDNHGCA